MRTIFALATLFSAAFAQDSAKMPGAPSSCGPSGTSFEVQDDSSHHPVSRPEAGKALVYVIREDGLGKCAGWGCATTRVGADGAWVGANRHNSYSSFAVDPGVRHLCVELQSRLAIASRFVGLAHFTAQAGTVYYFRARTMTVGGKRAFLDLEPIDSDQGEFLVASYPASISRPKK